MVNTAEKEMLGEQREALSSSLIRFKSFFDSKSNVKPTNAIKEILFSEITPKLIKSENLTSKDDQIVNDFYADLRRDLSWSKKFNPNRTFKQVYNTLLTEYRNFDIDIDSILTNNPHIGVSMIFILEDDSNE